MEADSGGTFQAEIVLNIRDRTAPSTGTWSRGKGYGHEQNSGIKEEGLPGLAKLMSEEHWEQKGGRMPYLGCLKGTVLPGNQRAGLSSPSIPPTSHASSGKADPKASRAGGRSQGRTYT